MEKKRGNSNLHTKDAGKFDQKTHWDGQSSKGHEGERWEGTHKEHIGKLKELGFHHKEGGEKGKKEAFRK